MSDAAKIAPLQEVVKEGVQRSSDDPDNCPHHFGYLCQRSKIEEISGVCMTCSKLLGCVQSKPKASGVLETSVTPIKRETSTLKVKQEVGMADEAKVHVDNSTAEAGREELKAALKPEIKTRPSFKKPSENELKVEDLDMLYASWSKTVRIGRQWILGWGKNIEEVEIETAKGKRARCKVYPLADSEKGVIQVPDKIQLNLDIGKGELVSVRPVTKR